jgi:hypothetical protein
VSLWGIAYPSVARADPIPISSGVMVGNTMLFDLAINNVQGPGLSISANSIGGFHPNIGSCIPCDSPVVNLGATLFSQSFDGPFTGTVGGVHYPSAWVQWISGTFTTPTATLTELGESVVNLPFSFSGVMRGFLENPLTRPFDAQPLFTVALAGSGRASARFFGLTEENGGRSFSPSPPAIRYEFAQPVPEPGTLFLVGGAIAALAARRSLASRRREGKTADTLG